MVCVFCDGKHIHKYRLMREKESLRRKKEVDQRPKRWSKLSQFASKPVNTAYLYRHSPFISHFVQSFVVLVCKTTEEMESRLRRIIPQLCCTQKNNQKFLSINLATSYPNLNEQVKAWIFFSFVSTTFMCFSILGPICHFCFFSSTSKSRS